MNKDFITQNPWGLEQALIQCLPTIMDNAQEELYIFDAETLKFKYVNYKALRNIGYSLEELKKLTPIDIKPEFKNAEFLTLIEPLRSGVKDKLNFNTVHLRKDGSSYPVNVRLSITHFEQLSVFFAIIKDIEAEIVDRDKLIKAMNEAEEANEAKSQFLAMLSHEMRTPLNAVIGFAEALSTGVYDGNPQKVQEVLNIIMSAGKGLDSILSQILDFSALSADEISLNLTEVDLKKFVESNEDFLEAIASRYSSVVTFNLDAAPMLRCDADKLLQIMTNLVSNAAKYGGEEVFVNLASSSDGSRVILSVRDNGAGISEEDQKQIFIAFQRTDKTRNLIEGTGLGLAICKALTEAMGGEISCESKVGQGSTFSVSFPV